MKLISRNQIFEKQSNLAKLIFNFQKDFFDEDDDIEDEMFDILQFQLNNVEYEFFIIEINHTEIKTYSKILSEKLTYLLKYLNVNEMTLISHLKLDFYLGIEHIENLQIMNSYRKLSEITNSNTYKEAISTEINEIEKLIDIFFWINEGNQGSEFIFWADINDQFCFYLCKYGKLHFVDFTKGKLVSTENLKKLGFDIVIGKCSDGIMLE